MRSNLGLRIIFVRLRSESSLTRTRNGFIRYIFKYRSTPQTAHKRKSHGWRQLENGWWDVGARRTYFFLTKIKLIKFINFDVFYWIIHEKMNRGACDSIRKINLLRRIAEHETCVGSFFFFFFFERNTFNVHRESDEILWISISDATQNPKAHFTFESV